MQRPLFLCFESQPVILYLIMENIKHCLYILKPMKQQHEGWFLIAAYTALIYGMVSVSWAEFINTNWALGELKWRPMAKRAFSSECMNFRRLSNWILLLQSSDLWQQACKLFQVSLGGRRLAGRWRQGLPGSSRSPFWSRSPRPSSVCLPGFGGIFKAGTRICLFASSPEMWANFMARKGAGAEL